MTQAPTSHEVPKEPAERRAWILYQLRRRGLSFRELARQEGVSQQAFSHACMAPSSHLERVIAEAIDLTPRDLFPERWGANGRRLTLTRDPVRHLKRSPSHPTSALSEGQRQKEHAA